MKHEDNFRFEQPENVDEEEYQSAFTYVPEEPAGYTISRQRIVALISVFLLISAALFGTGIYLGKSFASAKIYQEIPKREVTASTDTKQVFKRPSTVTGSQVPVSPEKVKPTSESTIKPNIDTADSYPLGEASPER